MRADFSKCYDRQLLAFLMALLRKPEDLVKIISKLKNDNKFFFAFNMYINMYGAVQKYMIAVDDVLPLTQEGHNMFCQVDRGYNVVLPFLEKAWAKYVHITGMAKEMKNTIYLEKILLGFLGSASVRLSTSHQYFKSEFAKHYFDGSYTFCFVREGQKQTLPSSHRQFKPYILNEVLEIDSAGKTKIKLFFMQADENGGGLGSSPGFEDSAIKSQRPKLAAYFDPQRANEQDLFYKTEADFMAMFDTVIICAHRSDEISRTHTTTISPSNTDSGKFDVTFCNLQGVIL